MKKFVQQVMFLICWLIDVTHSKTPSERTTLNETMQLLKDLTESYDKRLRPIYNQHDFIIVTIEFELAMIRSFDDVSGEITLLGNFNMGWIEERLQWEPSDYGSITEIILPKSDVWYPELFLKTSLNTMSQPGVAASKVFISSDGNAMMKSTDLITSTCSVDVTDYPNDYQNCFLRISPSGYSAKQMTFSKSSSVNHMLLDHNEWDILDVISYAESGDFVIEIQLKRHSTYATITLTIPIHLLGILNPWVFFLPPDSGERTSFSITTFLAFTVYMGILTDNIPKGSVPMAKLLFEVFSMLIYSVVILFSTIVSLQIHIKEGKKPVPCKVQKIIHFLSLACLCNRKTTISSMDTTCTQQYEKKHSISTIETIESNRSSPRRYSSSHLAQANLPAKDLAKTVSEERPTYPAHYEAGMTWTHVGNVFDTYMLLLFGLWFIVATIFFSVTSN